MSYTLETKAFFFNAKTDYLPYYKSFTITLPRDAVAKDILLAVQAKDENFSFPQSRLIFKINDLMLEGDTALSDIVKRLGTRLRIDPANSYRSCNGLIFNDEDFMQSYALLAPFATESDKAYYQTLYALHYASETERFNHHYIGDAILVLAYRMISQGNAHKESILEAITAPSSSLFDCEYENNLFHAQDHTASIEALKEMVRQGDGDEHPSLMDMIKRRFGLTEKEKNITLNKAKLEAELEGLEQKTIAYYAGSQKKNEKSVSKSIADLGTREITLLRKYKRSGRSVLQDNKNLALRKAGAIILDAYDRGAEVLIVDDEEDLEMFCRYFKEIQKVTGREIRNLDLIGTKGFLLQSQTILQT